MSKKEINLETQMAEMEKRVAEMEQRMDAAEAELKAVPHLRPAENVDSIAEGMLLDAMKGVAGQQER